MQQSNLVAMLNILLVAGIFILEIRGQFQISFSKSVAINDLKDLPYDVNNKLLDHWLLYVEEPECSQMVEDVWETSKPMMRRLATVPLNVIKLFFEEDPQEKCPIVFLGKGCDFNLIEHILPDDKLDLSGENGNKLLKDRLSDMQKAEVSWVTHYDENVDLNIYYLDNGRRADTPMILTYGERNTISITSYLGHEFEIENSVTREIIDRRIIEFNSFFVIGKETTKVNKRNPVHFIQETLDREWGRSRVIKRTYTEFGFNKGKLPSDLFQSMQTFYYNNRNNQMIEEFFRSDSRVLINWWESDVFMIVMPSKLKVCIVISINKCVLYL